MTDAFLNLYPCAGFMILMYIFETYLDIRQHRALKLPTLPKPLVGVISDEKFKRSRDYSLDKRFIQRCCAFSQPSFWNNFWCPNWLADLYLVVNSELSASSDSYFHFVHEAVTILMDTTILYYKVLPWFWKVKTNPLLQSISLCKYFGWSFLSSEIWRISYKGWFECWEWDNTHPCILSWCHGLVTGTLTSLDYNLC